MEEIEDIDEITVQDLLTSWNVSTEIKDKFRELHISLECLRLVTESDLKEIIPLEHIKDRILIRAGLSRWKGISEHNTDSETTCSIGSPPASPLSLSSTLDDRSSNTRDYEHIDLHGILNDSNTGKVVLAALENNSRIDGSTRNSLSKSIVEWFLKKKIHMRREDYEQISKKIVSMIPTECTETYYVPAQKYGNKYLPAKGKLVDRYNNQKRVLQNAGIIEYKRAKLADKTTEKDDDTIELTHEQLEDIQIWLKYNSEPWEEVSDKWKQTHNQRVKHTTGPKITDIVTQWPSLSKSWGYRLIEIDFDIMHPGKEIALLEKWPAFIAALTKIIKKDVRAFPDYMPTLEADPTEDTRDYIIISLLCARLVPSLKYKVNTANDKTKYIKPSIIESRDAFILHVKNQADVDTKIDEIKNVQHAKELTCQPFIVAVGPSYTDFKHFIVTFDEVKYVFTSLLKAVDICFKLFQVFDATYPAETMQTWLFIQRYFYGIKTQSDRKFTCVTSLMSDLSE